MKRRAAPIGIRIMRVLAWVVVGAMITVGVAWGVVLRSESYWLMKERESVTVR